MASNNKKTAKGGSSKPVTPLKIPSASPTPSSRQQDAMNARAATAMSTNPVTPLASLNAASGTPASGRRPSTTEQQKQSQASSTDQPRRDAPSSSASNRSGQSSASSSQRGHTESHGAGKPKSAGTKNK